MKLDFDAEVEKLNQAGDDWVGGTTKTSIETHIRRALMKVKTTPELRLAIYMKYNFGANLSGEDNPGWISAAKAIKKILEAKR